VWPFPVAEADSFGFVLAGLLVLELRRVFTEFVMDMTRYSKHFFLL
jgi:hypothetical protein